MISITNTIEGFEHLHKNWEDLYHDSHNPTPFQRFSYNFSAWQFIQENDHFSTLHIVCVYRQKDKLLQAIFPCFVDIAGTLRFINDRHTDFCSGIIRSGFEHDYHLFDEFASHIETEASIKGFCFDNLKADNYLFSIFEYLFKGSQIRMSNKWSHFHIPSSEIGSRTYVDALSQLNSKEKYRLKNIAKKMELLNFRFFVKSESPYPELQIESLAKTMIAAGIRTDSYFDNSFLNIFKKCYDAGVLAVAITYNENTPIAINLYLVNDKEYIDWIALYKESHYNMWNLLQMVEYIYENKGGVLNFARGQYQYKIHNFRPIIDTLFCITYSKGKFKQFLNWIDVSKFYLKRVVKPYIRK